ncbi:MAG: hypothetical protein AABO57_11500 [Acidobacteriota bacterium]
MRRSEIEKREQAITRGIGFIYRTACDPKNFAVYGFDYLCCFSLIASTSRDSSLRKMAREMGRERARRWRRENPKLPSGADPKTITDFIDATVSADKLGVRDGELKKRIRQAAKSFTVQDFLGFDPALERPPKDLPKRCRCGLKNSRGRRTCQGCKSRLRMQSRYETWMEAIYRGYRNQRSGVMLGTKYADAIRWLPEMRPYSGLKDTTADDFHSSVYAVTHVVYTLNDYGRFKLSPRWLPHEFDFLKENLQEAVALDDPEMVGEFLDTLKAFGLTDGHLLIRHGTEYLLSHQNLDGSWGNVNADDIHHRYHPTWTAIDGLRDYAWRGERLSFPKLKPWLEHWARKRQ